jgi:hypothetical protein
VEADELVRRRLRSVGLTGEPLGAPEEVVRHLLAVQSQDFALALWAVGRRLAPGTTEDAVEAAFSRGRFVRTHLLRPTWHFVAAEDLRWLLELTAPRVHALNAYMYRQEGLDEATLRRGSEVIAEALAGGGPLTRPQLGEALAWHGIETSGFRQGYLLMYAELTGVICSGARAGAQQTYALLDERVPPAPERDRDEALGELARRFVTGHGPASAKDLAAWSSLTMADTRRALALASDALERVDHDGTELWFAPGPAPEAGPSPVVELLQGYDELNVGFRETRGLTGGGRAGRPAYNGTVLLDGHVAGQWRRTLNASSVTVDARLQRPVEPAALQAAADALGRFLQRRAEVRVEG